MKVTATGSQTDAGSTANVVNNGYVIRNAAGENIAITSDMWTCKKLKSLTPKARTKNNAAQAAKQIIAKMSTAITAFLKDLDLSILNPPI